MRNLRVKKACIILLTAGTIVTLTKAHNNSKSRKVMLDTPIRGCDISQSQIYINWDEIDRNFDYVILRATYGNETDKMFKENYKNAKSHNLKVGIYAYNTRSKKTDFTLESFKKSTEERIDYLINTLKGKKIDYPVYLDIEYNLKENETLNDYLPKDYLESLLNIFYEKVTKAGYLPGLYSNKSTYDYLNQKVKDLNNKFEIWTAGGDDYNKEMPLSKTNSFNKHFNDNIRHVQSYDHVTDAGAKDANGHLDINYSYIDYSHKEKDKYGYIIGAGLATLDLAGIIYLGKNKKIKRKNQILGRY